MAHLLSSLDFWLLISVYAKLPEDISERWVLLLDPMLGLYHFLRFLKYQV